jgi:hypothetical protein
LFLHNFCQFITLLLFFDFPCFELDISEAHDLHFVSNDEELTKLIYDVLLQRVLDSNQLFGHLKIEMDTITELMKHEGLISTVIFSVMVKVVSNLINFKWVFWVNKLSRCHWL